MDKFEVIKVIEICGDGTILSCVRVQKHRVYGLVHHRK